MPSTAANPPGREPSTTSVPVFFVEYLDSAADEVVLDGAEGRHAATVRRMAVGESLRISNGNGTAVDGHIVAITGEALRVAVDHRLDVIVPEPEFVVVQALPKGDRGELAVALMTEVGVDRIVPWAAHRCVTQWREERGARSLGRWRAAAREASKQSRRLRMPEVIEQASTREVCGVLEAADLAIVLHERASEGFSGLELPAGGQVVIVVGPEGGLTDGELLALRAAGGRSVRLGDGILRTSTAGAAALAALAAAVGRWG